MTEQTKQPEVEVVDEKEEKTTQRKTYEDIQEEIKRLQSSQDKRRAKGSILKELNVNQLEGEVKDLLTQAEKIRRAVDVQGNGENFLQKASRLIPYFGKKISTKVEDTMFENSSLQDAIDSFMDSMTNARDRANSYLEQITEREEALEDAYDAGINISEYVEKEIYRLQKKRQSEEEFSKKDLRELNRWVILKTNLDGINQSNQFSLRQTEQARMTTFGMTENIKNLQPILENVLEIQGEIAGQNVLNKLMIETIQVGKDLVNEIQVQNQRDGNQLLAQTLEIATDPFTSKETLDRLRVGMEEGEKKLKLTMEKSAKKIEEYDKTIRKNAKALEGNSGQNLLIDLNLPEVNVEEDEEKEESNK